MASLSIPGTSIFPPTPKPEPVDEKPEANGTTLSTSHPTFGEHLLWMIEHDRKLRACTVQNSSSPTTSLPSITIDGQTLDIAEVVAVSHHRTMVQVSDDASVQRRVDESVDFLKQHLLEGHTVYGINTGFGGSADTRSNDYNDMQRGLIQHHNSGVMLSTDINQPTDNRCLLGMDLKSHKLPRPIVRAAILIRCNSLLRGHSAVRFQVIQSLVTLVNHDFIPVIPLRGSISASGDLTPLAYLAGALEGNPDIWLDCPASNEDNGLREIISADKALRRAGLEPITMNAKEGLGLMNGTAVSCGAAALALHEAQYLIIASQVLTVMSTEALSGSADNFHPFIADTRPHIGQSEAAQNIRRHLRGSQLVVGTDARTAGLYQDRYALRTASQWIGPQLEDIALAARQVEIELNSTTDNPLIDAASNHGHIHHGGNFQAAAVTSAMEKTRMALQMVGKLAFAQCSELINPMTNKTLTANLCFDDPNLSFTFKGVDINMAAYMSELAFLANPVSSHVQSAEMHNQAVNSLALISARYTLDAVELVSLMAAAYLYALCQALDLHAMYVEYMSLINKRCSTLLQTTFGDILPKDVMMILDRAVLEALKESLQSTKHQDTSARARQAAEASIVPITTNILSHDPKLGSTALPLLLSWVERLSEIINGAIGETRRQFAHAKPSPTMRYIGHGSRIVYCFVRQNWAFHYISAW